MTTIIIFHNSDVSRIQNIFLINNLFAETTSLDTYIFSESVLKKSNTVMSKSLRKLKNKKKLMESSCEFG